MRRVIRESVIRVLAAAGEWPIRVDVVTGELMQVATALRIVSVVVAAKALLRGSPDSVET